MRKRIVLIAALAGVASVAWAQPSNDGQPIDGRFIPKWEKLPGGGAFKKHYPRPALYSGGSGYAALCCSPNTDRTISCKAAYEVPATQGFGEAAEKISKGFRMTEASYQEFMAAPGNWLQVPILFGQDGSLNGAEAKKNLALIRQATAGLCDPKKSAPTS